MSVLTRMSSRRSIFETFACFTSRILASSSCDTSNALRSSARVSSAAIARVRARARARACLGIFATRLENFLAIARPFLFEQNEVLVVEPVRQRNELLIPTVVSGLVASDQQDRDAARIESIEHPIRTSRVLNAKLAHMSMPRPLYS